MTADVAHTYYLQWDTNGIRYGLSSTLEILSSSLANQAVIRIVQKKYKRSLEKLKTSKGKRGRSRKNTGLLLIGFSTFGKKSTHTLSDFSTGNFVPIGWAVISSLSSIIIEIILSLTIRFKVSISKHEIKKSQTKSHDVVVLSLYQKL